MSWLILAFYILTATIGGLGFYKYFQYNFKLEAGNQKFWRSYLVPTLQIIQNKQEIMMANFTDLFSKLDSLDSSVQAASAKIDELRNSDDSADQANVDAVAARVDAAKAALDTAVG